MSEIKKNHGGPAFPWAKCGWRYIYSKDGCVQKSLVFCELIRIPSCVILFMKAIVFQGFIFLEEIFCSIIHGVIEYFSAYFVSKRSLCGTVSACLVHSLIVISLFRALSPQLTLDRSASLRFCVALFWLPTFDTGFSSFFGDVCQ